MYKYIILVMIMHSFYNSHNLIYSCFFSFEISYILDAREMPFLSILETIFYKLLKRIESKQRESKKWAGRICPNIKKKLDRFTEWSSNCFVEPAGNYLYVVSSHEMEKDYSVDFKAKTCDCKR